METTEKDYIARAAEAVLFACGSAVSFDRIAFAVGVDPEEITEALKTLKKRYEKAGSSIELILYDDSAQFVTRAEYAEIVRTALELRRNTPLSRAALEVLAIIAYNQPTTRAFIDKVRGIESPSVVASLTEKGLIEEVGRLDAPGRPILYGTTAVFLRTFGLSSPAELGRLPELDEISREYAAQFTDGEQTSFDVGDGSVTPETEALAEEEPIDEVPAEGDLGDADEGGEQILFDDIEDHEEV